MDFFPLDFFQNVKKFSKILGGVRPNVEFSTFLFFDGFPNELTKCHHVLRRISSFPFQWRNLFLMVATTTERVVLKTILTRR